VTVIVSPGIAVAGLADNTGPAVQSAAKAAGAAASNPNKTPAKTLLMIPLRYSSVNLNTSPRVSRDKRCVRRLIEQCLDPQFLRAPTELGGPEHPLLLLLAHRVLRVR
jgi:hypothetical protein